MSQPTWVVQTNKLDTRHVLPVISSLKKFGKPYVDVGVKVGQGLIGDIGPELGLNLIPYGSTQLVKVALEKGWKHLYFDEETFRVDTWLKHRSRLLNFDARIMTLRELKDIAWTRTSWFVRPVKDMKEFPGHVVSGEDLIKWITRLEVGDCDIKVDCLVAASRPKEIQMEWRYFVVDRKIISGSSYRFKGQPYSKRELDSDVLAEAQRLADRWLPHPCCCMDVALSDGMVNIVEFNGINASGFYDHDIETVVGAISAYAERNSA